jgi:sortase A
MKTIQPWSDDAVTHAQQARQAIADIDEEQLDKLVSKTEALLGHQTKIIEPESKSTDQADAKNAAQFVRTKINALYEHEPKAQEELAEATAPHHRGSKHQQYIASLQKSGKSVAEIQTEWHRYYQSLSDREKHQVWQEFYEEQALTNAKDASASDSSNSTPRVADLKLAKLHDHKQLKRPITDTRTVSELKDRIAYRVSSGGRLKARHHLKSLAFGLGFGALTLTILLFSFFNERFIAPFISPSKSVSATPIIGTGEAIGTDPKIIIPKINLEVPVVYNLGTNQEKAIQNALEEGVVYYTGTALPGQNGNVAIVGHSSNNILNKGKYKFAFVLLNRLAVDDIFYLQKDGVRYTYKIYENRVVEANDVSVLQAQSKPNTATLITCDPPGTSLRRRVVVGEQISPDPASNKQATQAPVEEPKVLPSNAPSLWSRLFGN